MGKWGTGKTLKRCEHCNIEFYARHDRPGIYCSRSCAGKNKPRRSYRIFKKCKGCEAVFSVKRYRHSSAKFCSRQCLANDRGIRMRGESHPNWKGGVSERPYKARKAVDLAKKIKDLCEKCGSKENLHGHHVIKYSERPDLCDDIDNIEVICAECHAKEHPELSGMLLVPPVRRGIFNECHVCSEKYYIPPYKIGKSRWCSRKCGMIGLNILRTKNGQR